MSDPEGLNGGPKPSEMLNAEQRAKLEKEKAENEARLRRVVEAAKKLAAGQADENIASALKWSAYIGGSHIDRVTPEGIRKKISTYRELADAACRALGQEPMTVEDTPTITAAQTKPLDKMVLEALRSNSLGIKSDRDVLLDKLNAGGKLDDSDESAIVTWKSTGMTDAEAVQKSLDYYGRQLNEIDKLLTKEHGIDPATLAEDRAKEAVAVDGSTPAGAGEVSPAEAGANPSETLTPVERAKLEKARDERRKELNWHREALAKISSGEPLTSDDRRALALNGRITEESISTSVDAHLQWLRDVQEQLGEALEPDIEVPKIPEEVIKKEDLAYVSDEYRAGEARLNRAKEILSKITAGESLSEADEQYAENTYGPINADNLNMRVSAHEEAQAERADILRENGIDPATVGTETVDATGVAQSDAPATTDAASGDEKSTASQVDGIDIPSWLRRKSNSEASADEATDVVAGASADAGHEAGAAANASGGAEAGAAGGDNPPAPLDPEAGPAQELTSEERRALEERRDSIQRTVQGFIETLNKVRTGEELVSFDFWRLSEGMWITRESISQNFRGILGNLRSTLAQLGEEPEADIEMPEITDEMVEKVNKDFVLREYKRIKEFADDGRRIAKKLESGEDLTENEKLFLRSIWGDAAPAPNKVAAYVATEEDGQDERAQFLREKGVDLRDLGGEDAEDRPLTSRERKELNAEKRDQERFLRDYLNTLRKLARGKKLSDLDRDYLEEGGQITREGAVAYIRDTEARINQMRARLGEKPLEPAEIPNISDEIYQRENLTYLRKEKAFVEKELQLARSARRKLVGEDQRSLTRAELSALDTTRLEADISDADNAISRGEGYLQRINDRISGADVAKPAGTEHKPEAARLTKEERQSLTEKRDYLKGQINYLVSLLKKLESGREEINDDDRIYLNRGGLLSRSRVEGNIRRLEEELRQIAAKLNDRAPKPVRIPRVSDEAYRRQCGLLIKAGRELVARRVEDFRGLKRKIEAGEELTDEQIAWLEPSRNYFENENNREVLDLSIEHTETWLREADEFERTGHLTDAEPDAAAAEAGDQPSRGPGLARRLATGARERVANIRGRKTETGPEDESRQALLKRREELTRKIQDRVKAIDDLHKRRTLHPTQRVALGGNNVFDKNLVEGSVEEMEAELAKIAKDLGERAPKPITIQDITAEVYDRENAQYIRENRAEQEKALLDIDTLKQKTEAGEELTPEEAKQLDDLKKYYKTDDAREAIEMAYAVHDSWIRDADRFEEAQARKARGEAAPDSDPAPEARPEAKKREKKEIPNLDERKKEIFDRVGYRLDDRIARDFAEVQHRSENRPAWKRAIGYWQRNATAKIMTSATFSIMSSAVGAPMMGSWFWSRVGLSALSGMGGGLSAETSARQRRLATEFESKFKKDGAYDIEAIKALPVEERLKFYAQYCETSSAMGQRIELDLDEKLARDTNVEDMTRENKEKWERRLKKLNLTIGGRGLRLGDTVLGLVEERNRAATEDEIKAQERVANLASKLPLIRSRIQKESAAVFLASADKQIRVMAKVMGISLLAGGTIAIAGATVGHFAAGAAVGAKTLGLIKTLSLAGSVGISSGLSASMGEASRSEVGREIYKESDAVAALLESLADLTPEQEKELNAAFAKSELGVLGRKQGVIDIERGHITESRAVAGSTGAVLGTTVTGKIMDVSYGIRHYIGTHTGMHDNAIAHQAEIIRARHAATAVATGTAEQRVAETPSAQAAPAPGQSVESPFPGNGTQTGPSTPGLATPKHDDQIEPLPGGGGVRIRPALRPEAPGAAPSAHAEATQEPPAGAPSGTNGSEQHGLGMTGGDRLGMQAAAPEQPQSEQPSGLGMTGGDRLMPQPTPEQPQPEYAGAQVAPGMTGGDRLMTDHGAEGVAAAAGSAAPTAETPIPAGPITPEQAKDWHLNIRDLIVNKDGSPKVQFDREIPNHPGENALDRDVAYRVANEIVREGIHKGQITGVADPSQYRDLDNDRINGLVNNLHDQLIKDYKGTVFTDEGGLIVNEHGEPAVDFNAFADKVDLDKEFSQALTPVAAAAVVAENAADQAAAKASGTAGFNQAKPESVSEAARTRGRVGTHQIERGKPAAAQPASAGEARPTEHGYVVEAGGQKADHNYRVESHQPSPQELQGIRNDGNGSLLDKLPEGSVKTDEHHRFIVSGSEGYKVLQGYGKPLDAMGGNQRVDTLDRMAVVLNHLRPSERDHLKQFMSEYQITSPEDIDPFIDNNVRVEGQHMKVYVPVGDSDYKVIGFDLHGRVKPSEFVVEAPQEGILKRFGQALGLSPKKLPSTPDRESVYGLFGYKKAPSGGYIPESSGQQGQDLTYGEGDPSAADSTPESDTYVPEAATNDETEKIAAAQAKFGALEPLRIGQQRHLGEVGRQLAEAQSKLEHQYRVETTGASGKDQLLLGKEGEVGRLQQQVEELTGKRHEALATLSGYLKQEVEAARERVGFEEARAGQTPLENKGGAGINAHESLNEARAQLRLAERRYEVVQKLQTNESVLATALSEQRRLQDQVDQAHASLDQADKVIAETRAQLKQLDDGTVTTHTPGGEGGYAITGGEGSTPREDLQQRLDEAQRQQQEALDELDSFRGALASHNANVKEAIRTNAVYTAFLEDAKAGGDDYDITGGTPAAGGELPYAEDAPEPGQLGQAAVAPETAPFKDPNIGAAPGLTGMTGEGMPGGTPGIEVDPRMKALDAAVGAVLGRYKGAAHEWREADAAYQAAHEQYSANYRIASDTPGVPTRFFNKPEDLVAALRADGKDPKTVNLQDYANQHEAGETARMMELEKQRDHAHTAFLSAQKEYVGTMREREQFAEQSAGKHSDGTAAPTRPTTDEAAIPEDAATGDRVQKDEVVRPDNIGAVQETPEQAAHRQELIDIARHKIEDAKGPLAADQAAVGKLQKELDDTSRRISDLEEAIRREENPPADPNADPGIDPDMPANPGAIVAQQEQTASNIAQMRTELYEANKHLSLAQSDLEAARARVEVDQANLDAAQAELDKVSKTPIQPPSTPISGAGSEIEGTVSDTGDTTTTPGGEPAGDAGMGADVAGGQNTETAATGVGTAADLPLEAKPQEEGANPEIVAPAGGEPKPPAEPDAPAASTAPTAPTTPAEPVPPTAGGDTAVVTGATTPKPNLGGHFLDGKGPGLRVETTPKFEGLLGAPLTPEDKSFIEGKLGGEVPETMRNYILNGKSHADCAERANRLIAPLAGGHIDPLDYADRMASSYLLSVRGDHDKIRHLIDSLRAVEHHVDPKNEIEDPKIPTNSPLSEQTTAVATEQVANVGEAMSKEMRAKVNDTIDGHLQQFFPKMADLLKAEQSKTVLLEHIAKMHKLMGVTVVFGGGGGYEPWEKEAMNIWRQYGGARMAPDDVKRESIARMQTLFAQLYADIEKIK